MILKLFLKLYTLAFILFLPLLAPLWLYKALKRGGLRTGLRQRLGVHNFAQLKAYRGADYYHAVSVGEAIMAVKIISKIREQKPKYKAVVAVTTPTAHQFVKKNKPKNCLLCYAPIDIPLFLDQVFPTLSPRKVILVDSELWPNLLNYCKTHKIPVNIINGRLSIKSHKRFLRVKFLIEPLLEVVEGACLEGELQIKRWSSLGMPDSKLYSVGSLKFDLSQMAVFPPKSFKKQLDFLKEEGPVILISSSHTGEELAITKELQKLNFPFRLLVIPRHAERRAEIKRDLESLGYHVLVRTQFEEPQDNTSKRALLADTTGELKQWVTLSDYVIIGKSWLAEGGQNPFESIILDKLTICGPFMSNFEPLLSELVEKNGVIQLNKVSQLPQMIQSLEKDSRRRKQISGRGKNFLLTKAGAVEKTSSIILDL